MLQELTPESFTDALMTCDKHPLYKAYVVFGTNKDYREFVDAFQQYLGDNARRDGITSVGEYANCLVVNFYNGSIIEMFVMYGNKRGKRCHSVLYHNVSPWRDLDALSSMIITYDIRDPRGWGYIKDPYDMFGMRDITAEVDDGAEELSAFLNELQKNGSTSDT